MRTTLGLDIGTNSIGWALIKGERQIVDIGVGIFSDGRDPKSGASLAVDRRMARAMRRRRDRYLGRRSAFLSALVGAGLMPADTDEAKLVAALDPYTLRARALTDRLEPHEIGRALFHLNQRRGFRSNRKTERQEKPGEEGKIALARDKLDQAMEDAGAKTLGQFLAMRASEGKDVRVRLDSESQEYDFYPQRHHIRDEFDAIWRAQAAHHPALLTDAAYDALSRILFFQRPLKPAVVGVCLFAGRNGVPRDELRLPKAHPLFQLRRLYEEVNQLEITAPGEPSRKLTIDQRDTLIRLLREKREVAFTTLARTLKLQPGESFNKATEERTKMLGDEVRAVMSHKDRFGDAWKHKPVDEQWAILQRLIDEEDPDRLHAFLTQECGLDENAAKATAATHLPDGHGRIGLTATRAILAELEKDVVTYSRAVELAGWHHSDDRTGEALDRLPYYGELLSRDIPPGSFDPKDADDVERYWGKITNPTVHIGLRQVQKLVNAIIDRHGRPDQIVVELARDLKLNDKDRDDHRKRIRKDTADAERRSRLLRGVDASDQPTGPPIAPDTGANRALLKLWEELNPANPLDRRCPYCGDPIGIHALFTSCDVDHIIPYSRSLDDSASNKVVVHRACNRIKGNRTPHEKWGDDPDRWDRIAEQVARLHKSKQWRFGPDAMARVEKDGGFLARQLTDTQYLSRLAGKYLRSLYPTREEGSVYVIPGRMTAMLRRYWGLNAILPDHNYVENEHSNAPKNRLDHRHHAIDAAVAAMTTRGLLMYMARLSAQSEDRDLDKLFPDFKHPEGWESFRADLSDALDRVTVSHKPDHGRRTIPAPGRDMTAGRLHNDTAYGLTGRVTADGRTPIVVHRVPLLSLKPADLASPDRIPDAVLRSELLEATKGKGGKDFEAALKNLRKYGAKKCDRHGNPLFKGLRHVRVCEPLNVIAIRDNAGKAYKAYKGDANARFDVWRMPDGKWVSDIVSMFDAHRPDAADRRPHPAAKKMLSLRQNDMLAIGEGENRRLLRVVKFSTTGQIALADDNEAGPLKARDASPNDVDPFKYVLSSASGLKKLKARQVRIDPLGRILDPGPR